VASEASFLLAAQLQLGRILNVLPATMSFYAAFFTPGIATNPTFGSPRGLSGLHPPLSDILVNFLKCRRLDDKAPKDRAEVNLLFPKQIVVEPTGRMEIWHSRVTDSEQTQLSPQNYILSAEL
jgi:hypothetical protein